MRHVLRALEVSRQDAWANEVWWNWTGSWVVCAGPFGRWVVGAVLGFIIMDHNRVRDEHPALGYLIEEPNLSVVLTAAFAFLLSLFALVSDL